MRDEYFGVSAVAAKKHLTVFYRKKPMRRTEDIAKSHVKKLIENELNKAGFKVKIEVRRSKSKHPILMKKLYVLFPRETVSAAIARRGREGVIINANPSMDEIQTVVKKMVESLKGYHAE